MNDLLIGEALIFNLYEIPYWGRNGEVKINKWNYQHSGGLS